MKVCNVDLCLDSLVAFRSRCGKGGGIVRLKPDVLWEVGIVRLKADLLRAFAGSGET
jgi:hypothetical protein